MEDDEIVAGYVRHVDRDESSKNDDTFWAWEAVTGLIQTDPERAWRLLLSALGRCAPEHEHFIGAGPLEELLVHHPRLFAERVAKEVHKNERFREAFEVINFSTEFTSLDDANYFTETLRNARIPNDLLPVWRIADPDE